MTGRAPEFASSAAATDPAECLVFEFTAEPMAGPRARRALLAGNGALPSSVRDEVLLLVTELVTNAVRHANAGPDAVVRVELRRGSDFVGWKFPTRALASRPKLRTSGSQPMVGD